MIGTQSCRINVPARVLAQIPYFDDLISDRQIAQDVPYTMAGCSAIRFSTLLAFVRDGKVPDLTGSSNRLNGVEGEVTRYLRAYECALQFGLEAACNAILDRMCPVLAQASPSDFKEAFYPEPIPAFRDSSLFFLLVRQSAYLFQEQRVDQSFTTMSDNITEVIQLYGTETTAAIMTHLSEHVDESPVDWAMREPCSFHIHDCTSKCFTTKLAEWKLAVGSNEQKRIEAVEVVGLNELREKNYSLILPKDVQGFSKEQDATQSTGATIEEGASTSKPVKSIRANEETQACSEAASLQDSVSKTPDVESLEQNNTVPTETIEPDMKDQEKKLVTQVKDDTEDEWLFPSEQTFSDHSSDRSFNKVSLQDVDSDELPRKRGPKKRTARPSKKKKKLMSRDLSVDSDGEIFLKY